MGKTPGKIGRSRSWASASLVVLMLAACAGVQTTEQASGGGFPDDTRIGAPLQSGGSPIGAYLAGRHAESQGEAGDAGRFFRDVLEAEPELPGLRQRTVSLLTLDGRIAEALVLARSVADDAPEAPVASLLRISAAIKDGRFEDALADIARMPPTGLNVFLSPLTRAWSEVGAGRPEVALKVLTQLEERRGLKALYGLHVALVQQVAGNQEAAAKAFAEAAEAADGGTVQMIRLHGNFLERSSQSEAARKLYESYGEDHAGSRLFESAIMRINKGTIPPALISSPADGVAEAYFEIASSLRQRNARDTGLVFGRLALYLRPDFPLAQSLVGDILENEGRIAEAIDIYKAIDPDSPISWAARLRVATDLDRLDRTEEAVSLLRQMADDFPTEADPLINLGDILRGRKRFDEAVEAYDAAVKRLGKIGEGEWSLLYARGIALERAGDWQRAEVDFLKALEFQPEQPFLLNYLGYTWVDKGVNIDRARAMIEKAVDLRPNNGFITDSLGWVLYRMGDFEAAVHHLERAVELLPEDPVVNDHLGDALWRVGRYQEARFQWRRALLLDPEKDQIPLIEAKLKRGLAPTKTEARDG